MSQPSEQTGPAGGKTPKERRRLSAEQPYKRPRTAAGMPATRRSPARPPADFADHDEQVPLASIMQEFALLRKAMETRFTEADRKADTHRAEVVGKLDANDKAVSDLQLAVTDVTLSVDENQRAIHEVRAEVERREVELPGKVRAIVQEVLDRSKHTVRRPAGQRPRTYNTAAPDDRVDQVDRAENRYGREEDAYDLARRSLRLWPVSREGDLSVRTREFLVAELLVDKQTALDMKFKVRRVPGAGRTRGKERELAAPKFKDEVLVTFETTRERDDIRGHAKNLEKKGRGLRLEVPDHLWPSFRVLQELGYELKVKNSSLRRNILFDDLNRDLKMDFTHDSVTWKTVSPSDARNTLKKCRPARTRRNSVSSAELEQLLGEPEETDMIVNDEY